METSWLLVGEKKLPRPKTAVREKCGANNSLFSFPYTNLPMHPFPLQSLNGKVLGQAYPGVVN